MASSSRRERRIAANPVAIPSRDESEAARSIEEFFATAKRTKISIENTAVAKNEYGIHLVLKLMSGKRDGPKRRFRITKRSRI